MKLSIKAYADTPASVLVQVWRPQGVESELGSFKEVIRRATVI